jgi:CMP-N,N'-diacetyllegionaminic acid synthase
MDKDAKPAILALIPARGGSKSIPRKNLLMIAGKPLIAHSIEQALASRHITRTIVSTDDPEIAKVAREFGAEVPFLRPAEFAQDLSPDIDAFRHALQWLRDHERYECELVVHLRPTGPVRRVELIDQAIASIMHHPEADSLRSVSWPTQTPYKMWRIVGGLLQPLMAIEGVAEPYCLPRQALPEVFWQNGYVDIIRPRVVLEQGMMHGRKILPFVIEEPTLELDYADSIAAVEAALLNLKQDANTAAEAIERRHPV